MTPEMLRLRLTSLIDLISVHPWGLDADNRKLVKAVQGYLPEMPESELAKILDRLSPPKEYQ